MDLSKHVPKIFTFSGPEFSSTALEIFRFQYENNPVYHDYVNALKIRPDAVETINQIPFLPIRFFKTHSVTTTDFPAQAIFESSGTTGTINSRHFVKDLRLYERSFSQAFEMFYGPVENYCIIGLLPSYLERGNSSLVYMVDHLIRESGHPQSGFYLGDHGKLFSTLKELEGLKQKTILIGVTFALLDFAAKYSMVLQSTLIMETGGMKGRREEMIREEVHGILKKAFGLEAIHSEYGMTELLSQAYSKKEGKFFCPPWMKVLIRDDEDPLAVVSRESLVVSQEFPVGIGQSSTASHPSKPATGVINIIDLANIYSCSFIATDDAGRLYNDGSFEVIGRIDNSDIRGCSLMIV
jgi:hypothetical protein